MASGGRPGSGTAGARRRASRRSASALVDPAPVASPAGAGASRAALRFEGKLGLPFLHRKEEVKEGFGAALYGNVNLPTGTLYGPNSLTPSEIGHRAHWGR